MTETSREKMLGMTTGIAGLTSGYIAPSENQKWEFVLSAILIANVMIDLDAFVKKGLNSIKKLFEGKEEQKPEEEIVDPNEEKDKIVEFDFRSVIAGVCSGFLTIINIQKANILGFEGIKKVFMNSTKGKVAISAIISSIILGLTTTVSSFKTITKEDPNDGNIE